MVFQSKMYLYACSKENKMCSLCFFNEEQQKKLKIILMVFLKQDDECAWQKKRSRISWPYVCVKHNCIFFFVYFGLSLG